MSISQSDYKEKKYFVVTKNDLKHAYITKGNATKINFMKKSDSFERHSQYSYIPCCD